MRPEVRPGRSGAADATFGLFARFVALFAQTERRQPAPSRLAVGVVGENALRIGLLELEHFLLERRLLAGELRPFQRDFEFSRPQLRLPLRLQFGELLTLGDDRLRRRRQRRCVPADLPARR